MHATGAPPPEKFPYPRDLVANGFLCYLLDCLLAKYFVL